MTRLPSNLPALLKNAGLKVVVIDGWKTRERPPSTGGFSPVGVLNHHTGASAKNWSLAQELSYAKWMGLVGRPDLPAPLVQLSLGRSGTVYVIAAGRSNHAGTAKAVGTVAAGDGNSLYVGIEWMLSGTEEIPADMYAAGVTLNAVLTEKVTDTSVETIACHYQTSVTGKWDIGDPHGVVHGDKRVLDVSKFRVAVKARRTALYHRKPKPPKDTGSLPKIGPHGEVVNGKPSDHNAQVRDLWLGKTRIRIGGWNVEHSTNAAGAKPVVAKMIGLGAGVMAFNEVKRSSGIIDMLHKMGYQTAYNDPEFAIAWDPKQYREVRERDLVMSEHNYWLKRNEALLVVLEHLASGKRFRVVSEHPPAHVSRPSHPTFKNVLAVHQDVARKNLALAHNTDLPIVVFRDSNIDPVKDRPVIGKNWDWAYEGYEYLRADKPTRGKRFIDEFLIANGFAAKSA